MSEQSATAPESRALATLREIFEAGRAVSYLRSAEEARIAHLLDQSARIFFESPVPVWTWSLTDGLVARDGQHADGDTRPPLAALDFVLRFDRPAIFQFKDLHEALRDDPAVRRRLRDVYAACSGTGKYLIITSPIRFIPDEVARDLVYVELTTPDLVELQQFLDDELKRLQSQGTEVDATPETQEQLARALQGLTLDEAHHAILRALARRKRLDADSAPILLEEKKNLVNRTGVIEFISNVPPFEQIGGLEYLKKWFTDRRKLFRMRDALSADIVPKGVLVMGISGCGKSLTAKAIASVFGLPLYRIDMIEIFSGRHGKPEGAFAQTCRTLEQISPAVVWFDEIEMGITAQTDEASELGRIFAFFLTWMQEKTKGLFVVATANRIDLLPAEMIRKGRFDEVFFVDLPTDEERTDIFRIHLERRGFDHSLFNLERLKKFTRGWTGAECEQCVVAAITSAKLEDRELVDDDLLNATATVVPLSKTMKEQVDHIRAWAYDRAVRASPREATH